MVTGLIVLTDRHQARWPLPIVVGAAIAGGARTVVLRERDLPGRERLAIATALRALLAAVAGRLVVAGPDPLGGDAVHLAQRDAVPAERPALVGRSCHDEAELRAASSADYATVSPIYPSASKPGAGPPLGPRALADLAAGSPIPLVALGGVDDPARAAACRRAGAAGIAVMGAIMRSADPAATASALFRAWESARPRSTPSTPKESP